MHSIKKTGVLDFRQDGRLGVINLHIINVFLVGFCRRERERGTGRGMGLGVRRSGFQWSKVHFLLFPRTSFKRK